MSTTPKPIEQWVAVGHPCEECTPELIVLGPFPTKEQAEEALGGIKLGWCAFKGVASLMRPILPSEIEEEPNL